MCYRPHMICTISMYKRECSYLKQNELQRLKCDDTCNPIDFRGMASSYGRISTDSANMFFCELSFLNNTSKYEELIWNRTLVNLRKDGSLFHIAVVLDGLGLIRQRESPMLLQKLCWWQVDLFRLQHLSSTSM